MRLVSSVVLSTKTYQKSFAKGLHGIQFSTHCFQTYLNYRAATQLVAYICVSEVGQYQITGWVIDCPLPGTNPLPTNQYWPVMSICWTWQQTSVSFILVSFNSFLIRIWFTENVKFFFQENVLEHVSKMVTVLFGFRCVNPGKGYKIPVRLKLR